MNSAEQIASLQLPCPSTEDDDDNDSGFNNQGASVVTTQEALCASFSNMFPSKLYDLLMDAEANGFLHIVSFQPHGRAFKVHKVFMFESIILPDWFLQSKFASFQRQLYSYGFFRVKYGPDRQAYYHEKFLWGQPNVVKSMTKLSAAEKISRRNNRTATFPNFYAMPVLPSLRLMPRLTSHKALHCVLELDVNDENENGSNHHW